jgi:biotin operon repressor
MSDDNRTLDLFTAMRAVSVTVSEERYPAAVGHKVAGPSQEAAESMTSRAASLRAQCLKALAASSMTADEVADVLGESVLAIRPRISELRASGKVVDSGERRINASGKRATVWRLA